MTSFTTFVALRYLRTNRENRFFSWIAFLSLIGVAISVAVMIVVWSVIDGFQFELQKRFLQANAHILMYRYPDGVKNPEDWGEAIQKDFPNIVTGTSPFVHSPTMIKKGPFMQSVLVRGIHPRDRKKVQDASEFITPISSMDDLQREIDEPMVRPKLPAMILGAGLAKMLSVKVGDTVELISPVTDQNELKQFLIKGIYESGLKFYDNKLAILSLTTAQEFFNMKTVTGLEVGLIEPFESKSIAAKMEARYPLFTFREWQSFNEPLFKAIEMEKVTIFLIVTLVLVVAGFNILTTIFIGVTQKQREISILKALGAHNRQILTLFLKQGAYIGVLGGIVGCFLALGISYILKNYQIMELPDPYVLSSLPIHYDWRVYLVIAVLGVLMCMVAGLYPAYMASRVSPSQGFRVGA